MPCKGICSGKGEKRMFGIRLLTALYTIGFILVVLLFIGSVFGAFVNPMIDPGM